MLDDEGSPFSLTEGDDLMARGNDSALLDRENTARFGEHLNAQQLIRANDARRDPVVQAALARPTDEEATNEVLAELDSYSDRFDLARGETLISAAVHGHALVGVIEGPDGRHRKAVAAFTGEYKEPNLSPAEKAQSQRAKIEGDVAAETSRIRAEAEARVREAAEEAEREEQEAIARIKADADERIKKAQDDAQAESEAAAKKAQEDASARGSSAKTEAPKGAQKSAPRSRAKPKTSS